MMMQFSATDIVFTHTNDEHHANILTCLGHPMLINAPLKLPES